MLVGRNTGTLCARTADNIGIVTVFYVLKVVFVPCKENNVWMGFRNPRNIPDHVFISRVSKVFRHSKNLANDRIDTPKHRHRNKQAGTEVAKRENVLL